MKNVAVCIHALRISTGWEYCMAKRVAIIGGGIAGLSAGVYGQYNGFETAVFEQHTIPGGVCTGWTRQGYYFDYCIHWLVGSRHGHFHTVWQELGALQGQEIVDHEVFAELVDRDGRRFLVYSGMDRWQDYLIGLAPEDEVAIRAWMADIRLFGGLPIPDRPLQLLGLLDYLKLGKTMRPFLKILKRYRHLSMDRFVERFHNPFLRRMLLALFPIPDFPAIAALLTFSCLHDHNAGWPLGGSLPFARRIAARYRALGGSLQLGKRVKKILVRDKRACGLLLEDGSEAEADIVVAAADGRTVLFDMLDGRFLSKRLKKLYALEELRLFPPLLQVSLGVNRDLSAHNPLLRYHLSEPRTIAGCPVHSFAFKHYCFDPGLAPAGKSVAVVMLDADYDYWANLAPDRDAYLRAKEEAAGQVLALVEERYPGLGGAVEVCDVATPHSTVRYTGNWRGAYEGWLPNANFDPMKGLPNELPGLKNFYMIGQWTTPGGGLPPAGKDGRDLFQVICKREKRPFQAG